MSGHEISTDSCFFYSGVTKLSIYGFKCELNFVNLEGSSVFNTFLSDELSYGTIYEEDWSSMRIYPELYGEGGYSGF